MAVTFPLYILAGGKSTRFGTDKARAFVDGRPMLVAVAAALAERSDSVTVVAACADHYDDLGFRTIADVIPDKGPAGGILTALRDIREKGNSWALISSCDWLGLRVAWIDELAANRDGKGAVVFKGANFEPMPGLYNVSITDPLESLIAAGHLSLQAILSRLDVGKVACPPDWRTATNVNTPRDLDHK